MASRFQVYIGTDTRGRLPLAEVRQAIFDQAVDAFPHGHSIREEMGRWQHSDGNVVTERTIVVSWMASDEDLISGKAWNRVSGFAGRCKALCLQESVMIEEAKLTSIIL